MFKIRESGIQSREIALHQTDKPKCATNTASFVSVGLIDCYFGGLILCSGFAVAIILLIFEKICHKAIAKYNKQW